MTRDEIIALVLGRAGQRQGDVTLAASLRSELTLIQSRLEGGVQVGLNDTGIFLPWFLIKESATLVQEAGSETAALPTDFLMEYDEEQEYSVWYYASDATDPWIGVSKSDLSMLRRAWPGTGVAPKAYAIVGRSLYIRPVPTVAQILRVLYYGSEPELTDVVTTNLWTTYAADVLVGELEQAAARLTRDTALMQVGAADSKLAREKLHTFHVARLEAGRERFMGERR